MLSKLRFFLGVTVIILTFLCVPLLWLQDYAVSQGPEAGEGTVEIHIPRGTSLDGIEKILVGYSLIREDIRFQLTALLLGCADSLKAGRYAIAAGSTPLQILRILEDGDVVNYSYTIPEGYAVKQIGRLLEERFGYDRQEFFDLCRDPKFIRSLGLEVGDLEGYLFPDTYQLPAGTPLQNLVRIMVRRFLGVYDSLTETGDSRTASSFTRHEIITIASIVEKETGLPAERPMVASVIFNRLRRNMLLQVDPTVIYGLDKFGKALSASDLAKDTPYNSYLHRGLPPGPICSPGRAAIDAALHPARTSYLYFVARDDGSHEFSRNLRDHINAVNRFQRDEK